MYLNNRIFYRFCYLVILKEIRLNIFLNSALENELQSF